MWPHFRCLLIVSSQWYLQSIMQPGNYHISFYLSQLQHLMNNPLHGGLISSVTFRVLQHAASLLYAIKYLNMHRASTGHFVQYIWAANCSRGAPQGAVMCPPRTQTRTIQYGAMWFPSSPILTVSHHLVLCLVCLFVCLLCLQPDDRCPWKHYVFWFCVQTFSWMQFSHECIEGIS